MLARVRVQQLIVRLRMELLTDPQSILFQVKYTNQKRSCRTAGAGSMLLVQRKPVFFWIKSSARRAFGGCLGSKRR